MPRERYLYDAIFARWCPGEGLNNSANQNARIRMYRENFVGGEHTHLTVESASYYLPLCLPLASFYGARTGKRRMVILWLISDVSGCFFTRASEFSVQEVDSGALSALAAFAESRDRFAWDGTRFADPKRGGEFAEMALRERIENLIRNHRDSSDPRTRVSLYPTRGGGGSRHRKSTFVSRSQRSR